MISLQIPYPPSANTLFFNRPGKGRVKTERYCTWLRAAGNEVLAQRQEHIAGKVALVILVGRPDKRKRDLDNTIKPLLDLLVAHELIEDDSKIESLTIAWGSDKGAQVRVWPFCAERAAIRALPPEEDAA